MVLALVLLITALLTATIVTLVSRIKSNRTDSPLDIFLAVLIQFIFVNKLCFFVTLWPTLHYWKFIMTGVSLMMSTLMANYFCEVVLKPVFIAIVRYRP
jgi:hypothetical protein